MTSPPASASTLSAEVMEFFKEIAFHRAARRMWARVVKEKFGAKNERSMTAAHGFDRPLRANVNCTVQRPMNNLIRSSGWGDRRRPFRGPPNCNPPFDEPLGLGWSLEAIQLSEDAARILQNEARLTEVIDPLAGSYYVESLTDQIENAAWAEFEKIQAMGGAVRPSKAATCSGKWPAAPMSGRRGWKRERT